MPRDTQPSTGSSTTRPLAVRAVDVGDDLVAGHERERHDRLEVARRVAVDGAQIAPADAGQSGLDVLPARARKLGRIDVAQPERADLGAAAAASCAPAAVAAA